ncbi:MAG TPA: hypothetical protein VHY82_03515 [Acetobacteraceae bacterium]|nr:hypothetical protein [Acetobacteraceae bacterium]
MVQQSRLSATAALFGLVLLLAGCADERSPRDLGDRLQTELAPELANGDATLERLPDGARVTLADQTLFPVGGTKLGERGRFVLSSLVEGLLAPPLLTVDVAGPVGTSEFLPQARATAVAQFLRGIQVAPNLLFTSLQAGTPPGGVAPQATTITVTTPGRSSRTDHPT